MLREGLLTADTGGLELNWGNSAAVVALTEQIARREGFGAVLADGSKRAAEQIGRGSEQFAMHVCGRELPLHDPRANPGMGMFYISDATPSQHCGPQGLGLLDQGAPLGSDPLLQSDSPGPFQDYDKKGELYARGAAYWQLLSSAGLCSLYAQFDAPPVVELLRPVTGWDMDCEEAQGRQEDPHPAPGFQCQRGSHSGRFPVAQEVRRASECRSDGGTRCSVRAHACRLFPGSWLGPAVGKADARDSCRPWTGHRGVVMKVGFIGTGQMGVHMARHVLEAGFDLVVSDARGRRRRPCWSAERSGLTARPMWPRSVDWSSPAFPRPRWSSKWCWAPVVRASSGRPAISTST